MPQPQLGDRLLESHVVCSTTPAHQPCYEEPIPETLSAHASLSCCPSWTQQKCLPTSSPTAESAQHALSSVDAPHTIASLITMITTPWHTPYVHSRLLCMPCMPHTFTDACPIAEAPTTGLMLKIPTLEGKKQLQNQPQPPSGHRLVPCIRKLLLLADKPTPACS